MFGKLSWNWNRAQSSQWTHSGNTQSQCQILQKDSPLSQNTPSNPTITSTLFLAYIQCGRVWSGRVERECVCGCGARACVRACILALVYMRACKCVYVYAVYTIWACVLSAEYPVWMGEVADFPETEGVQLQIQSVPFPTSGMWPNVQGMTSRGVWPLKSRVWEWKQQTVEMSV